MQDLTIPTKDGVLTVRTGAVIIRDGKMLFLWSESGGHYYTIGGRIKFGESVEEALKRELTEELGQDAALLRGGELAVLNENFFESYGVRVHEYGFYYRFDGSALPENVKIFDGADRRSAWLTEKEVKENLVYPLFFAERFEELKGGGVLHLVNRA